MTEPTAERRGIARPPTVREVEFDRAIQWTARICAVVFGALVVSIVLLITKQAMPAIVQFGPHFVISKEWDAGKGQFGIVPEIFGTLVSSAMGVGGRAPDGRAVFRD